MPSCSSRELWSPSTAWVSHCHWGKIQSLLPLIVFKPNQHASTPCPHTKTTVSSAGFDSHTLSQAITNLFISQRAWQRFCAQPALLGDSRAPGSGRLRWKQLLHRPPHKWEFVPPPSESAGTARGAGGDRTQLPPQPWVTSPRHLQQWLWRFCSLCERVIKNALNRY